MLDAIAEAFSGDRELFKGLWIYNSDYGFEKHPVIRIDMGNIANKTDEALENELSIELMKRVRLEGFSFEYKTPPAIFKTLIEELHIKHGQRVVVLIDEYDKPILDHLDNPDASEANRKVLKSFYGILKSMDPHIRMAFVTGVSKFSKSSIFSEMNNMMDITLTKNTPTSVESK